MSRAAAKTKSALAATQQAQAADGDAARLKAASALAAQAAAFASTLPAPPRPVAAAYSSSSAALSSTLRASSSAFSAPSSTSQMSAEEKKTFASKFRAAQKTPALVGLQITALDGLVAFLKQKRATAGRIIRESEEEIARIEREEALLHIRYDPLAEQIRANEAKRDAMLQTKREADEQMSAIIAHTGAHVARTTHAIASFKQRQLRQEMDFERNRHQRATVNPNASAAH